MNEEEFKYRPSGPERAVTARGIARVINVATDHVDAGLSTLDQWQKHYAGPLPVPQEVETSLRRARTSLDAAAKAINQELVDSA